MERITDEFISNLNLEWMFEITRKCRCNCQFCLRGNSQNKSMDAYTFRHIIDRMNCDNIAITGGEPLLNTDILREMRCIRTSMFSFITSGNIPRGTFDEVLESLMMIKNNCFDAFFEHSVDVHHPKSSLISDFFYKAENWGIVFSSRDNLKYGHDPIRMGRSDWGKDVEQQLSAIESEYNDFITLYVTIDGFVYPSCDLSYAFMRKFKKQLCLGNAINDSIESIMRNYYTLTNGKRGILIANEDGFYIKKNVSETQNKRSLYYK